MVRLRTAARNTVIGIAALAISSCFGPAIDFYANDSVIASLKGGTGCIARREPPVIRIIDCDSKRAVQTGYCETTNLKIGKITESGTEVSDIKIEKDGQIAVIEVRNPVTDPEKVAIRVDKTCD